MQISKFTKKVDSNEDYHSDPSISSSGLKVIADRSVEYYLNRPPFKTTDAMELGTAIHEKLLFPDQFDDQYFELPKLDLRKKADKETAAELKEKNKGKIALTTTQMDAINGIYRNALKKVDVQKYLDGNIKEVSHYGKIDGVPVRFRPDCMDDREGWISDIKSCQNNKPNKFRREIYDRHYHVQAYFYSICAGFDPARFRFIAVETKPPYLVQVYGMTEEMIDHAEFMFHEAFFSWKVYVETGHALGYMHHQCSNHDDAFLL